MGQPVCLPRDQLIAIAIAELFLLVRLESDDDSNEQQEEECDDEEPNAPPAEPIVASTDHLVHLGHRTRESALGRLYL